MMKIEAVIFDLDGVICSTDDYHYKAWKELANKIGITNFTREDNNRQRGISRMESLEVLLEKTSKQYSQKEKEEMANYKNELYKSYLEDMNPSSVSGIVLKTLKDLKEMHIKIAIGSSSKNTRFILQKIGIIDMFDAICDGNMITKSKPDPEVFLKACELLGETPDKCLVVEDAISGIEAAKRGGFTAVGISTASKSSLCDYPIASLLDIEEIIMCKK